MVFEISEATLPKPEKSEKHIQYYNFSNANVTKFVKNLESEITKIIPSENFTDFTNCQYLGKFLKKLYLSAFTALQHHKTFCIIINLVLGNHIPPVMQ